jgi:hypothetical protein
MSLVLSVVFWTAGTITITLGVAIAVYMVLGLLLVLDFRKSHGQDRGLQLQAQFLYDTTITPSELVLENPTTLERPRHLERQILHLAVEGARQQP